LGIYHVGVAAAFRYAAPDVEFSKLCGASAGAIVATAIAGGIDICKSN
jgi:predicted acylesterase/phospholipase RssA